MEIIMKKIALLLVSILLASCQGGTSSSSAFTGNSSSTQDESSLSQSEAKMTRVEAMNTFNSYRKHIGEASFQAPNKITLSFKETIDGQERELRELAYDLDEKYALSHEKTTETETYWWLYKEGDTYYSVMADDIDGTNGFYEIITEEQYENYISFRFAERIDLKEIYGTIAADVETYTSVHDDPSNLHLAETTTITKNELVENYASDEQGAFSIDYDYGLAFIDVGGEQTYQRDEHLLYAVEIDAYLPRSIVTDETLITTIDGEKDTFHAITTSTYQWGICNTDKPDLRKYSQLG